MLPGGSGVGVLARVETGVAVLPPSVCPPVLPVLLVEPQATIKHVNAISSSTLCQGIVLRFLPDRFMCIAPFELLSLFLGGLPASSVRLSVVCRAGDVMTHKRYCGLNLYYYLRTIELQDIAALATCASIALLLATGCPASPRSTMHPSCKTRISSAMSSSANRCVTITIVWSRWRARSHCKTARSVMASR